MINRLRALLRREPTEPGSGIEGGLDGPGLDAWREFSSEGSNHPLQGELEQQRWAAQSEAVATAQAGFAPDRWPGGQLSFEFERGLAHEHEVLRDRQAVLSTQWLTEAAADVHEAASGVVSVRKDLATADEEVVEVAEDWNSSIAQLRKDPIEQGRYYRSFDEWPKRIGWLLIVVFVLSEFVMTGQLFEAVVSENSSADNLGYLLALGVMVILVAVPHYAAQGLKEGITRVHGYHQQDLEERGERVSPETRRARDNEVQDDRGFRIAATCVGLLLLAMILPLSWLRADHIGGGSWLWFAVFTLLQLCLSGYFFLREWHAHSGASADHKSLKKRLDYITERRDDLLEDLLEATDELRIAGENYLALMRAYPRQDDQIVSSYWATIHFHRHVMVQVNPELAPYINLAAAPQPAATEAPTDVVYPLDPIQNEHPSIESPDSRGRLWLRSELDKTLMRAAQYPFEDGEEIDGASWRTPDEILDASLRAAGHEFAYRSPVSLAAHSVASSGSSENPAS